MSTEDAREMIDRLQRELTADRATIDNLEIALHTSRRIGAAIGILMCRRSLREEEAFDLLRTTSQRSHRKLREVADSVIYTGDLPSPDTRRRSR